MIWLWFLRRRKTSLTQSGNAWTNDVTSIPIRRCWQYSAPSCTCTAARSLARTYSFMMRQLTKRLPPWDLRSGCLSMSSRMHNSSWYWRLPLPVSPCIHWQSSPVKVSGWKSAWCLHLRIQSLCRPWRSVHQCCISYRWWRLPCHQTHIHIPVLHVLYRCLCSISAYMSPFMSLRNLMSKNYFTNILNTPITSILRYNKTSEAKTT